MTHALALLRQGSSERTWRARRRFCLGFRSAFCDFAAGGDENVLTIKDGNRV
jgi:hypothetical protein